MPYVMVCWLIVCHYYAKVQSRCQVSVDVLFRGSYLYFCYSRSVML